MSQKPFGGPSKVLDTEDGIAGGYVLTMTGPVLDTKGSTWSMPSRGLLLDGSTDE